MVPKNPAIKAAPSARRGSFSNEKTSRQELTAKPLDVTEWMKRGLGGPRQTQKEGS